MLPFALKLTWFILSITGTLGSCFTLLALGALVGSQWIPISFSVALVVLELMFCFGMVWHMDPFSMPRGFCIAQTIIMNAATYATGGICMAWCIQTSLHILRPKMWPNIEESFRWRPMYLLPAVVYPVLNTLVLVVLVAKYDAVQPADGMYCDAMDPLWIRMIVHTAPAVVLFAPSSYISITCIIQVMTTLQHVERARRDQGDIPRQLRRRSAGMKSDVPVALQSKSILRRLQGTFAASPHAHKNAGWDLEGDGISVASSESPTFAPVVPAKRSREASEVPDGDITEVDCSWMEGDEACINASESALTSEGHGTAERFALDVKTFEQDLEDDDEQTYRLSYVEMPERATSRISRVTVADVAKITPHIYRLLVFQLLFSASLPIDMLSSVIDAASHRSKPPPFATHQVSILLVAWGPIVIFGSSRDVRRRIVRWITFWRY